MEECPEEGGSLPGSGQPPVREQDPHLAHGGGGRLGLRGAFLFCRQLCFKQTVLEGHVSAWAPWEYRFSTE